MPALSTGFEGPFTLELASGAALLCTAVCAAWLDVRKGQIPNALTVGALSVALLLRVPMGHSALASAIAGASIAFSLGLVLFLLGGSGGGDVKLLAAVGAFLGPTRLWPALLVMVLVGGVMAIGLVLRRRATRSTTANLHTILATFGTASFTGWRGRDSRAAVTLETTGVLTVPFGVAISVGALAGWLL